MAIALNDDDALVATIKRALGIGGSLVSEHDPLLHTVPAAQAAAYQARSAEQRQARADAERAAAAPAAVEPPATPRTTPRLSRRDLAASLRAAIAADTTTPKDTTA